MFVTTVKKKRGARKSEGAKARIRVQGRLDTGESYKGKDLSFPVRVLFVGVCGVLMAGGVPIRTQGKGSSR